MEQTPNTEILESQFKKETYLFTVKKRFQNTKHYVIKKRYKEEENLISERVTAILKKMGWIKEGRR
jgi:hypothetical protein